MLAHELAESAGWSIAQLWTDNDAQLALATMIPDQVLCFVGIWRNV